MRFPKSRIFLTYLHDFKKSFTRIDSISVLLAQKTCRYGWTRAFDKILFFIIITGNKHLNKKGKITFFSKMSTILRDFGIL